MRPSLRRPWASTARPPIHRREPPELGWWLLQAVVASERRRRRRRRRRRECWCGVALGCLAWPWRLFAEGGAQSNPTTLKANRVSRTVTSHVLARLLPIWATAFVAGNSKCRRCVDPREATAARPKANSGGASWHDPITASLRCVHMVKMLFFGKGRRRRGGGGALVGGGGGAMAGRKRLLPGVGRGWGGAGGDARFFLLSLLKIRTGKATTIGAGGASPPLVGQRTIPTFLSVQDMSRPSARSTRGRFGKQNNSFPTLGALEGVTDATTRGECAQQKQVDEERGLGGRPCVRKMQAHRCTRSARDRWE